MAVCPALGGGLSAGLTVIGIFGVTGGTVGLRTGGEGPALRGGEGDRVAERGGFLRGR